MKMPVYIKNGKPQQDKNIQLSRFGKDSLLINIDESIDIN